MNATQITFLAAAKVDGVTNSFMASVPRSEFFKHVIYELPVNVHGKFELFRHTTIIFSTGPQFVSHCWRTFKNRNEIVVMTLDKFDGVHFKNQLMNEWHSFDTNVVEFFQFNYVAIFSVTLCVIVIIFVQRRRRCLWVGLSVGSLKRPTDRGREWGWKEVDCKKSVATLS